MDIKSSLNKVRTYSVDQNKKTQNLIKEYEDNQICFFDNKNIIKSQKSLFFDKIFSSTRPCIIF